MMSLSSFTTVAGLPYQIQLDSIILVELYRRLIFPQALGSASPPPPPPQYLSLSPLALLFYSFLRFSKVFLNLKEDIS